MHARLKEERKRLKLTQAKFAELGGVSKWSQLDYEKGTAVPNAAYLQQLLPHGVDVVYVLSGERASDELTKASALADVLLNRAEERGAENRYSAESLEQRAAAVANALSVGGLENSPATAAAFRRLALDYDLNADSLMLLAVAIRSDLERK